MFNGIRVRRAGCSQRHQFGFGSNLGGAADLNIDSLRRTIFIDHLQINDSAFAVASGIKEDPANLPRWRSDTVALGPRLPFARRNVPRISRENFIAVHGAEHLLCVISRRAVAGQRVIADEIGAPLHRTIRSVGLADVDEKGRVAGHHNDVRIQTRQ